MTAIGRRRRLLGAVLATGLLVAVSAGSDGAAGVIVRGGGYWILLVSDRDGQVRGYGVRPDGSRLTPLLTRRPGARIPVAVSGDGTTIAYTDLTAIYVSRADGTGLRRLVRATAFDPVLSRDGRLLAFRTGDERQTVSIIGTDGHGRRRLTPGAFDSSPDWSPDGTALVYRHGFEREMVVVQPLHGRRRVIARGGEPSWSPNGRWIAYVDETDLWVVRPSGAQRHRVARRPGAFEWSPDGTRLAVGSRSGRDIEVVDVDRGRSRSLRVGFRFISTLKWSPDELRLVLAAGHCCDGSQIWIVGLDGRGRRRLTDAGTNNLVGWTGLAPVLPRAVRVPPTERVTASRTLELRAPVRALEADGARVAFIAGSTATDCRHVAVWTPGTRSVRRFASPAPCVELSSRDGLPSVAIGSTRVAWLQTSGGNTLETSVVTATLARRAPVEIAYAAADEPDGTFAGRPVADRTLLGFTVRHACDSDPSSLPENACPPGRTTGDVVATTLWRFGGDEPCPGLRSRWCSRVLSVDGELRLLAVEAGRLVVRTGSDITLLTAAGGLLRDFPVDASAAELSGNRLALRTPDAVEIYDAGSGLPSARLAVPRGTRLEGLRGDILATAKGGTVSLLRLTDGRKATLLVAGTARARLEGPGLFVAGSRRVTFTPFEAVRRLLDGA